MCRVHHADLLAHFGQWAEAEREAERACEELREIGWIVGFAYNTIGQIRLRRGDLEGAARAFRESDKQAVGAAVREAGVARLLLAQGNAHGAMARVSRALPTTTAPLMRARLLPAHVDIATGDLDTAAHAVDELDEIAATFGTLKLRATATLARSQACLARHRWTEACAAVTTALQKWHDLHAPYEIAVAVRSRPKRAERSTITTVRGARRRRADLPDTRRRLRSRRHRTPTPTDRPRHVDGPATAHRPRARRAPLCRHRRHQQDQYRRAAHREREDHRPTPQQDLLSLTSRAAATAWAFQHDIVPAHSPQPPPPTPPVAPPPR